MRTTMGLLARLAWGASRAVAIAFGAMLALPAGAEEAPPFKLGRYDEDYRYLAEASRRTRPDDALKYIALGASAWLSLGGEWRERFERFDAPRFGIGSAADSYVLQRLLLHADLHLGPQVRFFLQLGREDAFGKQPPLGPSDVDRNDVQNAFLDVAIEGSTVLRLGRHELLLNPVQRFVSVREGPNVRQSFDGLSGRWASGELRALAFATRPVLYRPGAFDDASDTSQRFWGAAFGREGKGDALQGYVLGLDRTGVRHGATQGDERTRSIGVRWAGHEGALDHDVEAIAQLGSFAQQQVRAWALGAIGGYTFPAAWSPRLGLELDVGSGDHDGPGGRLATFNPLFPKGAYFNESATIGWSNLVLVRSGITVSPLKHVTLGASIARRWRQTGADAVYLQPSIPLAATLGNQARLVGDVYQVDASWHASRYLNFTLQALRQTAGPAISLAGGHSSNFATLIAQARF